MKVLRDFNFSEILEVHVPSTSSGHDLLEKYRNYCSVNPINCSLVNSFLAEARSMRYDDGINAILEEIDDYLTSRKISWALGTACESIQNNGSKYNYLNKNASRQVEKLLEMDEQDVIKYIRSGSLKNVMFCEAFRSIAKSVFKNRPLIEKTSEYTRVNPVSMTYKSGEFVWFVVEGKLYAQGMEDASRDIVEGNWNDVPNSFRTISSILAGRDCEITEDNIILSVGKSKYTISEKNSITSDGGEYTPLQLREHALNLLALTQIPNRSTNARLLEGVSLISENYDNICSLDNVGVFTSPSDKFVVVEHGDRLYAELIASNHSGAWVVDEDALKACEFIRSKTGINLISEYSDLIEKSINKADEESAKVIKEQLENNEVCSIKNRIENLTEKFKNDPVKLAVLSKLAQDIQTI